MWSLVFLSWERDLAALYGARARALGRNEVPMLGPSEARTRGRCLEAVELARNRAGQRRSDRGVGVSAEPRLWRTKGRPIMGISSSSRGG